MKHWHSTIVNGKLVRRYIKDEDILERIPCAELMDLWGRIQIANILLTLPIAGQGFKSKSRGG